jgi:hypothetical protein
MRVVASNGYEYENLAHRLKDEEAKTQRNFEVWQVIESGASQAEVQIYSRVYDAEISPQIFVHPQQEHNYRDLRAHTAYLEADAARCCQSPSGDGPAGAGTPPPDTVYPALQP